jgi:Urease accessory protein UreH
MSERTGVLRIGAIKKGELTIPDNLYYQGALKLMRPQYLDESGQLTFFILNPGGGYVDGDRYTIDIKVQKGADLYLTTQSATKIYETPQDKVCQRTKITLEPDSSFIYIPDAVIPYENSIYEQSQEVHMSSDAFYFTSEILTPGWTLDGAGFYYKSLNISNHIYVDNKLAVADRLLFTPQDNHLSRTGMLEGYSHLGAVTILAKSITDEVINRLRESLASIPFSGRLGLSKLAVSGLSMRALGNSTQEIERLIYACYDFARLACRGQKVTRIRKF